MKTDNALNHRGCDGCQHQRNAEKGSFCYMFANKPEELPCSQHDSFESQRKKMGKHTFAFAVITGMFSK